MVFYKGYKHTTETRKKMSETRKSRGIVPPYRKGIPHSEEHKKRIGESNKKAYMSIELRKRTSERQKGEKSHRWKGGITDEKMKIRNSLEYRLWRESVFKRDNYTCVWCLQRGGKLNADHIKPFSIFPELRFAIDNGRTLCLDCHKKTDTFAGKARRKND